MDINEEGEEMNAWLRRLALIAALGTAAAHAAGEAAASAPQAADPEPAASAASPANTAKSEKKAALAKLAVALEPVTYSANAKVEPSLREDCKIEQALQRDVGKMLHHYGLGGRKAASTQGRTLKMQITEVTGDSGGAWTGPKSVTAHMQLFIDGRLERETDMTRVNVGANPFRGTCHVLHQHTKTLGRDVARWLKDERYKVFNTPDDEPDEPDAADDKEVDALDAPTGASGPKHE
jgi:hypothetical protein